MEHIENSINKLKIENETSEIFEILKNILKEKSTNNVAIELNVANGTINRWLELKKIPKLYQFDIMKLNNMKIDYSKYNYKDKDQFYTPVDTAKYCYTLFLEIIKKFNDNEIKYTYIEPAAGCGNFLKILPSDRTIALDIEPKNSNIIEQDYLLWKPENMDKKYIIFGNPPFGLRGHLALKFINHSFDFADYVCFILPQLFESDGKGVPRKRVIGYNLLHSEKLNTNFIEPNGKEVKINCIFQIWSKFHKTDEYNIKNNNTDILKIYSLSDGGTPSSTRNKKMLNKCDIYIPSTCFGKNNMKYYENFEDLPGRKGYGIVFNKDKVNNIKKFKQINWTNEAFLSTNSAYNIRMSQIYKLFNL